MTKKTKNLRFNALLIIFLSCFFCIFAQSPKQQMRAAWIATVANIDFPSQCDLTPEAHKKELIDMLDAFKSMNINTVVFQIRPASDAFYISSKEPWSQWLTGTQGQAANPFYDPLEFLIQEAHARCMEVHVWLNPYRVSMYTEQEFAENHPSVQKKHLIKEYGGKYYFDPGYKETRDYLNEIVADIVMRYDINAVHFDDYFYPYKINNVDFPDNDTFKENPREFAENQKEDWRRDNVNLIIAELQKTIKSIKPWVEFGISPFGVWRNESSDPRGSKTSAGMTNYDDLYADILKWLEDGNIDYVVPQLYWEIGRPDVDYSILIDWWANNSYGRNLYIGLFASGLNNGNKKAWKKGNELVRQMELNKEYPQQKGIFLYSARPLLKNPLGICDSLQNNFFKYPALVPTNPNIKGSSSAQPSGQKILKDGDNALITWQKVADTGGNQIAYYVVYCFEGEEIGDINNPANIIAKTADNFLDISEFCKGLKGKYTFTVTSVNKFKHESPVLEYVVKEF
jgi:uncharacterized lipoprotein YddW (UPF0748 family)